MPPRLPKGSGLALVASVVAILGLTLVPIDSADEDLQLLPFSHIVDALTPPVGTELVEMVLNVLLFLPFGAALSLRRISIGVTILVAAALSATVELAQLLVISGRTTSVDDVLLNTIGALLGHVTVSAWTAREDAG